MKTKNERWIALSESVQLQNDEPHIKCLRNFMKLSHLLGKYLDSNLGDYNLNRTQRRIIVFILANQRPMTPTELSKLSFVTLDTVNKSIDALDKMKLTRSYRSRTDRRVRKVTLTDKGLEVMETMLPHRREVLSLAMDCLEVNDIDVLSSFLEKLSSQLNKITEDQQDQKQQA